MNNFKKVTKGLYRGSAPSPKDILLLKKDFKINKVISLDKDSGEKISRTCKILGIIHLKMYIDKSKESLLNILKNDLEELLISNGPTFIHCLHGKDRTGLIIALFQCKYMGFSPEKAIKEAKSFGFGIGVDPDIVDLYEKLIKSCKSKKDLNNADIVSNERDGHILYPEQDYKSFAPFLDPTRKYPEDFVYNNINNQSQTRENYNSPFKVKENNKSIPLVGIFNNDSGIHGAGPAEPVGGFINE